jgi:hypothetical protein
MHLKRTRGRTRRVFPIDNLGEHLDIAHLRSCCAATCGAKFANVEAGK